VLEVGVPIATKGGGDVHGLDDTLSRRRGVGAVGGGVVVGEGAVIGDGVDGSMVVARRVHRRVIAVGRIAHDEIIVLSLWLIFFYFSKKNFFFTESK